jgi:hypothetical protein
VELSSKKGYSINKEDVNLIEMNDLLDELSSSDDQDDHNIYNSVNIS